MPLALLIVLWLIAVGAAVHFAQPWLPLLASVAGRDTDHQLRLTLAVLGLVFLLAQFALGYFLWRFRVARDTSHAQVNESIRLEFLWLFLATALFFGLNIAGARVWARNSFLGISPAEKPILVEVTAEQFRWYFRYPGADGRFGATKPELEDASLGNPLGIDHSDPAAQDDIISSSLVVPANRDVDVTLRSHDVIHSFFVPALRFKQDAVPGMTIRLHFTATQPGTYDIACAELCGLGHHTMNAKLKVLDENEFAHWQQESARK